MTKARTSGDYIAIIKFCNRKEEESRFIKSEGVHIFSSLQRLNSTAINCSVAGGRLCSQSFESTYTRIIPFNRVSTRVSNHDEDISPVDGDMQRRHQLNDLRSRIGTACCVFRAIAISHDK